MLPCFPVCDSGWTQKAQSLPEKAEESFPAVTNYQQFSGLQRMQICYLAGLDVKSEMGLIWLKSRCFSGGSHGRIYSLAVSGFYRLPAFLSSQPLLSSKITIVI